MKKYIDKTERGKDRDRKTKRGREEGIEKKRNATGK